MSIRRGGMVVAGILWLAASSPSSAQVAEVAGSRALGMAGAFVAVASDSSATWWNPAGLASGPFVDVALARAGVRRDDSLPARRDELTGFTVGTPPIGVAYYRFRFTQAGAIDPTERGDAGRDDGRVGVPLQALSGNQFGVTLVHSVAWGVHTGATLKFVSGAVHTGRADEGATPSDLLDAADHLVPGETYRRFDVDLGLLAVAGPVRLGARVQNLLEPEFDMLRLPRQVRVGVALDPEYTTRVPLTIALDADVNTVSTIAGERRVVAVGAEYWLASKRIGVRGGGRFNTAGAQERAAAAGASVAIRTGLYVDAHASVGDEKGWGLATRVSF